MPTLIIWDLETVPDLQGFAAANDLVGKTDAEIRAPGLSARPYFNRYSDDAIDLCDVLSSFSPQAKATLHELCKVMGMSGKPDSIVGSEVGRYFLEGKIKEIADYCETDIVNTYRMWLRYELFRGKLTPAQFQFSEQKLEEYINARGGTKPHLHDLVGNKITRNSAI